MKSRCSSLLLVFLSGVLATNGPSALALAREASAGAGCHSAGLARTQTQSPRFEDFPAGKPFAGKPVALKLTTRNARKYRTVLREGAAAGPNFAGHYAIVTWGCGSSCVQFAVVDEITGDVYFPSFYVAASVGSDQDSEHLPEPLQFKLNSKLLVVTGNLNEAEKGGVYNYKWEGNRLVPIVGRKD
ncbi:MAG TPA: hypothetical protein VJX67_18135 [Blastocatellia bacterium]|nr:hypothetical protein [Blastocatellia bacterium]